MEFLRERVFTALNADELKQGDKVITARCMADLKTWVEADAEPNVIELIQDETNTNRFTCKCFGSNKTYDTSLAYLVERAENCTNCGNKECRVPYGAYVAELHWCKDYKPKTEPHYRPFRDTDELIKVWGEKIKAFCDEIPPIIKPLIWVRRKGDPKDKGRLITAFNDVSVELGEAGSGDVLMMDALFEMFTFLDRTPCGVEE